MAEGNGKAVNGVGGAASNGKAYPIEDHTYDVVVVGAGGSGLRGLADRVDGLGGHLTVQSPPGGPTRLVASLPIGDRPR